MPERKTLFERMSDVAERQRLAKLRERAPYGPMCADHDLCAGKGYCPRDPTCAD